MTTIDDVTTEVEAYASETTAAALAPVKTALDTAQATVTAQEAQIASLTAQLADLQAKLTAALNAYAAYVAAHPDVITFSDFKAGASSGLSLWNTGKSLIGAGSNASTYYMNPNTSTYGPYVAALVPQDTNQCHLIRMGSDASHGTPKVTAQGFTLQGTAQGHIYGGLEIGYSNGAVVSDVVIKGIPGNASGPPGETFGLNMWHANHSTVDKLAIDGGGVAATLLGLNTVTDCVITNSVFNGAVFGFGAALWQCSDITFKSCTFSNNRKAINIEDTHGGTIRFKDCTFHNTTGAAYVAQVSASKANDPNRASSKVIFEDPVVDSWPLKVAHYPGNADNLQKDADIRLIINGVDVSSDKTKLQFV